MSLWSSRDQLHWWRARGREVATVSTSLPLWALAEMSLGESTPFLEDHVWSPLLISNQVRLTAPNSRQTRPRGIKEQSSLISTLPWPRTDLEGPGAWWRGMAHIYSCISSRAGPTIKLTSGRTSVPLNVSTGCLDTRMIARTREGWPRPEQTPSGVLCCHQGQQEA